MTGEFLMGWPRTAPLPPTPRRVRAARQRATSVVDEVFAEFARAVTPPPKTPRRPESDPRLTTGGAA